MRSEGDAERVREIGAELRLRSVGPPQPDIVLPAADDAEWLAAMEARLLSEIDEPERDPGDLSRETIEAGGRHRRPRVWLAAASVLVAVAVVIGNVARPVPALAAAPILTFSSVDPGSLSPRSGDPARTELEEIARRAARAAVSSDTPSSAIQHVVTQQWRLEVDASKSGTVRLSVRPTADESWLFPDGRHRLREVQTAPVFSAGGQITSEGRSTVVRDEDVPSGEFGPAWPTSLPRDPAELEKILVGGTERRAAADPTPEAVVLAERISDLYDTWVVPPGLAGALWATLARTGVARDLGDVEDRLGRAGRGIAVWDAPSKTLIVLVVDPESGRLLSREDILFGFAGVETRQTLAHPVVGSFVTYVSAGWVSSVM